MGSSQKKITKSPGDQQNKKPAGGTKPSNKRQVEQSPNF